VTVRVKDAYEAQFGPYTPDEQIPSPAPSPPPPTPSMAAAGVYTRPLFGST